MSADGKSSKSRVKLPAASGGAWSFNILKVADFLAGNLVLPFLHFFMVGRSVLVFLLTDRPVFAILRISLYIQEESWRTPFATLSLKLLKPL